MNHSPQQAMLTDCIDMWRDSAKGLPPILFDGGRRVQVGDLKVRVDSNQNVCCERLIAPGGEKQCC